MFWLLRDASGQAVLVAASTPLSHAEAYGECLTFADSHHDVWERWRAASPAARVAAGVPETVQDCEYDETPRGRIVYHEPDDTFWLYADRRLQGAGMVGSILKRFALQARRIEVRSDAHYR